MNDILSKSLSIDALPVISVLVIEGEYYSLNNRRLYVLKELNKLGQLKNNEAKVRIKVPNDKEKLRYTPARCSLVATVMKERPVAIGGVEDNDLEVNSDMSEGEI